jgi:hypothetical protein
MFINRPRLHDLTRGKANLEAHFRWETINVVFYKIGGIIFIIGSIFFLSAVGWFQASAWTFVVGSLLFVVGACINVLQIVQAQSIITLQLMNLTAVSFVVGSVLFTVASVTYLWDVKAPSDRTTLYTFLAWQYLTGSLLFFIGGVFNYWRAYLVMRKEIKDRNDPNSRKKGSII